MLKKKNQNDEQRFKNSMNWEKMYEKKCRKCIMCSIFVIELVKTSDSEI